MAVPAQSARGLTKSAPSIAYRVELTERADRNLRRIYLSIESNDALQACSRFPARGARISEDDRFRQLLYGSKRHRYRIIHPTGEVAHRVTVLTIRHGSRNVFSPNEADHDE
jgi:plasmid stabilization system protein ParE